MNGDESLMANTSSTSNMLAHFARFRKALFHIAIFCLLLYLFLSAITLMGGSFKLLGKEVATSLFQATSNPFVGLLIGILVTSLVQSSSVTTSMIVALVSGGGLTVVNAIPMIMGANIGTTITNTIVSIGHVTRNDEFERAYSGAVVHDCFNLLTVAILLPIELLTGYLAKTAQVLSNFFYGATGATFQSPVKAAVKPLTKSLHGFLLNNANFSKEATGTIGIILGFIFILITLFVLVKFMRRITATQVEGKIQRVFSANGYITIAIGIAITILVQSSSITTSILVPMLGAGILSLEQAFPLTLGANLGTTITVLLASLAGNQAGLTIALAHLIFNISGTAMFYPWEKTRQIPLNMARKLARFTVRNKKFAGIYILLIFFILPLIGMYIMDSI